MYKKTGSCQPEDEPPAVLKRSDSATASTANTYGEGTLLPKEPGIWLLKQDSAGQRLIQLEPTVYTQSRSGGLWKTSLTYGIAKAKSKAVLASAHASLQIDNARPTFYFNFEVKSSGLSNSGAVWAGGSSSANEFVLVKMDVKKNSREVVVGQFGAYGAESGTLDKYVVAFDFEKLAPGLYRVTPREQLAQGEYCFYYGGSAPTPMFGYGVGFGPHVFDFGYRATR